MSRIRLVSIAALALAAAAVAATSADAAQIRYQTAGQGNVFVTGRPDGGPNLVLQNLSLRFSLVGDTGSYFDDNDMGVRLIAAGAPEVVASWGGQGIAFGPGGPSPFQTAGFSNTSLALAGLEPGETQVFADGFAAFDGAYAYGTLSGVNLDLGAGFIGAGLAGWDGLSAIGAVSVALLDPDDSPEIDLKGGATWHLFGLHDLTFEAIALGGSAENPLVPLGPGAPDGGFVFNFDANAGHPVYIDPYVAYGYDYQVGQGSPLIATALFPTIGASVYDIYALGDLDTPLFSGVAGGQTIDFRSLPGYENGIAGFSLRGIDVSAGLDPENSQAFVTGLTFASDGVVSITQTPVSTYVPEPGVWALMLMGFGGIGAALRARRLPGSASA